jgi:hypothetical protein
MKDTEAWEIGKIIWLFMILFAVASSIGIMWPSLSGLPDVKHADNYCKFVYGDDYKIYISSHGLNAYLDNNAICCQKDFNACHGLSVQNVTDIKSGLYNDKKRR